MCRFRLSPPELYPLAAYVAHRDGARPLMVRDCVAVWPLVAPRTYWKDKGWETKQPIYRRSEKKPERSAQESTEHEPDRAGKGKVQSLREWIHHDSAHCKERYCDQKI